MANVMNFKEAPEWLKLAAITRRQAPNSGAYKYNSLGIPKVPNVTSNRNENDVLEKLYESNANTYNKTKTGKSYKSQYVKSGDGFVHSDYGAGSAGAAIPYQIGTRSVTRKSSKKADVSAYDKAQRAQKEAIRRRLNG
jgi:hypothetical protein